MASSDSRLRKRVVQSQGRGSRRRVLRLTTAQALVRYLSVQYSERDGKQQRFIPGVYGIFGHGNVAGLGQALDALVADSLLKLIYHLRYAVILVS